MLILSPEAELLLVPEASGLGPLCLSGLVSLCIYLPSEQELGSAGSGCASWAEHLQWQSQRTGIKNVAERAPLIPLPLWSVCLFSVILASQPSLLQAQPVGRV